jgi:hypothetical protein
MIPAHSSRDNFCRLEGMIIDRLDAGQDNVNARAPEAREESFQFTLYFYLHSYLLSCFASSASCNPSISLI